MEYGNGLREGEYYAEDVQLDAPFFCFGEDPKFGIALLKGVEKGRRYRANIAGKSLNLFHNPSDRIRTCRSLIRCDAASAMPRAGIG